MDFDLMVRARILRRRQKDVKRIKCLVNSAEKNARMIKTLSLNDDTATIIFREIYESIRQLGDASWWLGGYEPLSHEISLDGLKDLDIKDRLKLNFLPRFKKIRNGANYQGLVVFFSQAKEIMDFWDTCSKDIIRIIREKINND